MWMFVDVRSVITCDAASCARSLRTTRVKYAGVKCDGVKSAGVKSAGVTSLVTMIYNIEQSNTLLPTF